MEGEPNELVRLSRLRVEEGHRGKDSGRAEGRGGAEEGVEDGGGGEGGGGRALSHSTPPTAAELLRPSEPHTAEERTLTVHIGPATIVAPLVAVEVAEGGRGEVRWQQRLLLLQVLHLPAILRFDDLRIASAFAEP